MKDKESVMTNLVLEKMLEDLKKTSPRRAAEVAYALAKLHQRAGDIERATHFGRESISLFDQCEMKTLHDCAPRYLELRGVVLPSLIHQNVVRARLSPLRL